MAITAEEATAYAEQVIRALSGYRWTWPARQVIDRYPVTESGRIRLTGTPVISISRVAGPRGDIEEYEHSGQWLQLPRLSLLTAKCAPNDEIEVEYSYGSPPPQVVQTAVEALANELLAAYNGGDCRLPERVTSVTREGMSFTLIDPQDFLDDGRTGIYEVDLALRAVNPSKAKARARVFSAGFPPAMRSPGGS